MNHPKEKMPHRRRYRLNKKKFAMILVLLGCMAALIVVAAESLANAGDVSAVAMGAGIPKATELIVSSVTQTPNTDTDDVPNDRLIVLDAGHGGFDPGAIGVNDTHEDVLNLAVTQYLRDELEACGIRVIMTREDENAIADNKDNDMAERRRIIEQSGSDIVISIHMNSYEEDPDVSGPLVLFMPNSVNGKRLADTVQQSLCKKLDASGTARSESLYVLQSGNQPCILVECGYISNEEEERKLNQPDYQQKVAKGICEGVMEYFLQTNVKEQNM